MSPASISSDKVLGTTAWLTELLRLTAFYSEPGLIDEPNWWMELVRESPERKISEPRRGQIEQSGPFSGGNLKLNVAPGRIDWTFTVAIPEDPKTEPLLTLGDFDQTLDSFLPLASRWLEIQTLPRFQRIAFGAILLQPVEDRETGYRKLSQYLPSVKIDPVGSSDFSYRINRKRDSKSGVQGLKINRLTKWTVALHRFVRVPLGDTAGRVSALSEQHACRLELDINTVPEFQTDLDVSLLPRLFHELVDLGLEIANTGDVA
jgi:hypothetical protein